MKWSGVMALGLAAATSAPGAQALSLQELTALDQELSARSLLDVASATACATQEPCGTNACMASATIALNPICGGVLADFGGVVNEEASNGDSMGVVALMAGGTLDDAMTTAVCNSFINDTVATTCLVPAPMQAVLATMREHADGGCLAFNSGVFGLFPSENSTAGDSSNSTEEEEEEEMPVQHTATANATATEKAVINAAFDASVNATGGDAAAVSAALAGLGLQWTDFAAASLGFLEETDVAANIMGAASTCMVAHFIASGASSDVTALGVGAALLANSSAYSEAELSALFETTYGPTATTEYLTALAQVADFPAAVTAGVQGVLNQTMNETELMALVVPSISSQCAAAQVNASASLGVVAAGVSGGSVNLTDATSVATVVGTECAAADNATTCAEDLMAEVLVFGTCMATTGAVVDTELTSITANVTAYLMMQPGVVAITGMGPYIATCFQTPYATVDWYINAFSNFNTVDGTAEETAFVSGSFLGSGCALYGAGLGASADPTMVGKTACYQLSIAMVRPDLAAGLSEEAVYSLEASVPTMQERCAAVNIDIGNVPTYVTSAPTNAVTPGPSTSPTAAGEAEVEEEINAGNLMIPSMLLAGFAAIVAF